MQDISIERDVVYTDATVQLAMDIYRPKTLHPMAVLIFIHGGAWMTGDKSQAENLLILR